MGKCSVEYTITDGNGLTSTSEICWTVIGSPPTAQDASFTIPFGTTLNIDKSLLMDDVDGDLDTFVIHSQPVDSNGVSSGDIDPDDINNCTFSPERDFSGDVTFQYCAIDAAGNTSLPATITITVEAP